MDRVAEPELRYNRGSLCWRCICDNRAVFSLNFIFMKVDAFSEKSSIQIIVMQVTTLKTPRVQNCGLFEILNISKEISFDQVTV